MYRTQLSIYTYMWAIFGSMLSKKTATNELVNLYLPDKSKQVITKSSLQYYYMSNVSITAVSLSN